MKVNEFFNNTLNNTKKFFNNIFNKDKEIIVNKKNSFRGKEVFYIVADDFGYGLFKTNSDGTKIEECIAKGDLSEDTVNEILNSTEDPDTLKYCSDVFASREEALLEYVKVLEIIKKV